MLAQQIFINCAFSISGPVTCLVYSLLWVKRLHRVGYHIALSCYRIVWSLIFLLLIFEGHTLEIAMYIWGLEVSIQDNSSRPALSHLRTSFLRREICIIRFPHHRLGCSTRQTCCEAHMSDTGTSLLRCFLFFSCSPLYFSLLLLFLPHISLTLFEA